MFKKILMPLFLILFSVVLIGCNDDTKIKSVDVSLTQATRNKLVLEVTTVEKGNKEEELNTTLDLNYYVKTTKDGKDEYIKKSSSGVRITTTSQEVVLSNLEQETTYYIVFSTVSGEIVNFYDDYSKSFTTTKLGLDEENAIEIKTVEDFIKIKDDNTKDTYYKLANDLDLSKVNDGTDDEVEYDQLYEFKANLDGNGKTLKNFKGFDFSSRTGIFGVNSGVIKNLKIEGFENARELEDDADPKSDYTGTVYLGSLVGENKGTIKDVTITNTKIDFVNGTTLSETRFGLLTGSNSGTIKNITIDENSKLTGEFKTRNAASIGSVVGYNDQSGIIKNVESKADIEIKSIYSSSNELSGHTNVGGLVGRMVDGSLVGKESSSTYDGDITVNALRSTEPSSLNYLMYANIGGICGHVGSGFTTINNVTTTGKITVDSKNFKVYVGGLFGTADVTKISDVETNSEIVVNLYKYAEPTLEEGNEELTDKQKVEKALSKVEVNKLIGKEVDLSDKETIKSNENQKDVVTNFKYNLIYTKPSNVTVTTTINNEETTDLTSLLNGTVVTFALQIPDGKTAIVKINDEVITPTDNVYTYTINNSNAKVVITLE